MVKKLKILLLEGETDDDKTLAQMYQEILKFQDFKVERAERKSFEEIKAAKPDFILLILLDPYQTKKDKIELLKILKEDQETKEIPNFILSNYQQNELKEIELKTDKFLTITDFTPSKLGKFIRQRLQEQSQFDK